MQGADAMIGEIASIVDRVKSKLYIVAPRLEDIDFVSIRNLSSRINVRIASNIDPKSSYEMKILEEFIDKKNMDNVIALIDKKEKIDESEFDKPKSLKQAIAKFIISASASGLELPNNSTDN